MRLLLVGGGHTHLLAMPLLRRRLPDWRIGLLSPGPKLLYSGMMPGWIAGQYGFDDCTIDLPSRCHALGIEWLQGAAIDLDFAARRLVDSDGRRHGYDALSLNVGSAAGAKPLRAAAGMSEDEAHDRGPPVGQDVYAGLSMDPGQDVHAGQGLQSLRLIGVKPFTEFAPAWADWLAAARTRPAARRLVVVGGGAAAIEIAFALARRAADEAVLAGTSVSLAMSGTEPLDGRPRLGGRLAERSLRRAGIALLPGHEYIGHDHRALHFRVGDRIEAMPAHLAILATGAKPPGWLTAAARRGGVAVTDDGAIAVDSRLRSVSTPGVWASGDCAGFVDQRVPRSGVHALKQAPALAASVALGDAARPYRAQRHALALLNRCDGTAIAIRGPVAAGGRWAWRWKDRIDRRFVAGFEASNSTTG